MQLQLNTKYQRDIYNLRLKYPNWTQRQIADKLNVSHQLVGKIDRKRKIVSLIQVPELVKKRAYQSMEETSDRLEIYITELEDLKHQKNKVIIHDTNGTSKVVLMDKPSMEIANLIKIQIDTSLKINELRTLDEPMKILDWIGTHKLSEITK